MADQPRLLAPVAGYTQNPAAAIDRLEAVDADERSDRPHAASRGARTSQEWMRSRERIRAELDHLREVFGPLSRSDVRAVRYDLDRIDARVRAG